FATLQSVQRATPQLLSPSGIGSRFPAQAVQLFSFDRNLRSIVAVGSTRLESPWLRARWKVGGFDLSSIRSRPRFCVSNSGPTKEKAVTYQTWQRQIFRGKDQSDDHLHNCRVVCPGCIRVYPFPQRADRTPLSAR